MSKEPRDKQIMVNLEESVYEAARNYAARSNVSSSGYVRSLIINDLYGRGLLTDIDIRSLAGA